MITTNYDLVLENLLRRTNWGGYQQRKNANGIPYAGFPDQKGFPRILKLHGSCNWYREGNEILTLESVTPTTLFGRDLVIGTPGVSKQQLAIGELNGDWISAKKQLREAEVVSIVGYSLPETDNVLRMMILDQIAESPCIQAVNIVLGTRSERGYRAEEIIKQAMPDKQLRGRVRLLPMYAQDYLPTAPEKATEWVFKGDHFLTN
ncbi:MAG: SIR2 family protein [Pirellula sp.]